MADHDLDRGDAAGTGEAGVPRHAGHTEPQGQEPRHTGPQHNEPRPPWLFGKSAVDTGRLEQHFAARCRAVVRVPYDAHLDEGAEVELDRLNGATADAFLMLAAETGDGLARPPKADS